MSPLAPFPVDPVDLALARSVLYGALAVGWSRPSAESLTRLRALEATDALAAGARLLDAAAGGAGLAGCAIRLLEALPSDPAALAARYEELFGHTVRGRVCLFETEYGPAHLFQQPHALADLAGYYRAFGFDLRRDTPERADHVGCECEFMALLCLKDAWCRDPKTGGPCSEDDTPDALADTLAATCGAQRRFLRDHLGRVAPTLAALLAREDRDGFYAHLAALLAQVVERDGARLGLALGTATLTLRPPIDDEPPMACESGETLIQIQGRRLRG